MVGTVRDAVNGYGRIRARGIVLEMRSIFGGGYLRLTVADGHGRRSRGVW